MTTVLILAFLQLFAPNRNPKPETQNSQGTVFTLRVEQKKKDVPIAQHEVLLKKKFFDLVFEFNQPGSVACIASFDSTIFTQARQGLPARLINGLEFLGERGAMDEKPLNPDQELFIGTGKYNLWHYKNRTDNRFNRFDHGPYFITCWRSLGRIQLLDTHELMDIAEVPGPLYLVFAQPDGGQVDYLKINWK